MFKIFDEKDSSVFLKLVSSEGKVRLAAVDERGYVLSGGYLLDFRNDGTFCRCNSVSAEVGIKTVNGKFEERT